MKARLGIPLLLSATLAACGSSTGFGARSLLGAELPRIELPAEREGELQEELDSALERHRLDPEDEDAAIWHGRRLAYLGRYREAVEVFGQGLEANPKSYKLRRHRGHRYITLRRFEDALADLAWARDAIEGVPDEIEPDGAPNASGIPRSTNHSNIWYHLALAHWLQGDFERAADAWERGLVPSRVNDDMLVATSYWLFLARMRCGRGDEARALLATIRADMEILENHTYHRLLRTFQGALDEATVLAEARSAELDSATALYGLGLWRLLNGDEEGATALWESAVPEAGSEHWPGFWPAFGYIAAEAELARRR